MGTLLEMFVPDISHITFLILIFSLIISGILLIIKTRFGIYINFFQFPLKIYFTAFSFWFLLPFFRGDKDIAPQYFIFCTILELVRILTEFLILKKLSKK